MQLQIDFSGKKTERITFAADEDLKKLLEAVSKKLNRHDISDLVREYVIECATRRGTWASCFYWPLAMKRSSLTWAQFIKNFIPCKVYLGIPKRESVYRKENINI